MSTYSENGRGTLDPEACWSILERVAGSRSLKRAARLREFLIYAGTQSLRQGRTDIHEQEIGETVFARPRSYDTSQDNIVRVSATELRKRVDAYFATEGRDEALIFEIPRGSYAPLFRLRESSAPAVGAPVLPAASAPRGRVLLWIVAAIALLFALASVALLRENQRLERRIQFLEHPGSTAAAQPKIAFLTRGENL